MKIHLSTFNQEFSISKVLGKKLIETLRKRYDTMPKSLKSKQFIDRIGKIK